MSAFSVVGLIAFTILFLSLISYCVHTFIARSREIEESLLKQGKLDESQTIDGSKDKKIKAKQDKISLKQSIKGICGQFLYSCIGVVVWCIMYEFGYLVGIFGFFIMSFTLMGFKYFKRVKLPKIAFISGAIIGFIQIFVAEFLSLILDVVLMQAVTFKTATRHVINWFLAGNVGITIIIDLVIGFVVALLTLIGFYIYNKYNMFYKKIKKSS